MTMSLAAVFDGTSHRFNLRRLARPAAKAGELWVRVRGCTICGSDRHTFEGRRTVPTPTVLGHEIVGEIIEPTTVRDLSGRELNVGDRVTWAIVASCGSCFLCERGLPQKCEKAVKYGHEAFRDGRELLGGLAEYCLLAGGSAIVKLPAELPLSVACPASCATATVAASLEAAGDLRHRTVAVFGAGMLGLTACAMASAAGAAAILCVDPEPRRRELARRFGATHVAGPSEAAEAACVVSREYGLDAVLEFAGDPAVFQTALPLVRLGGTIVLVGSVFPSPPTPLALEQVVRRQLTIRGLHNYAPRHLLAAVEFLTRHHTVYPFDDLVVQWYPLVEVEQAFARGGAADAIRVGVSMG